MAGLCPAKAPQTGQASLEMTGGSEDISLGIEGGEWSYFKCQVRRETGILQKETKGTEGFQIHRFTARVSVDG